MMTDRAKAALLGLALGLVLALSWAGLVAIAWTTTTLIEIGVHAHDATSRHGHP